MSQPQHKAESDVKKVYFIWSPHYNVSHVEKYLNKRRSEVYTQNNLSLMFSDIKSIEPDYIFIAMDHTDSYVNELYKEVTKLSINTVICPYIVSSQPLNVLNLVQMNNPIKVFPPISGPSIERAIFKYEKNLQRDHQHDLASAKSNNLIHASNKTFVLKGVRSPMLQEHSSSLSEEQVQAMNIVFDQDIKLELEANLDKCNPKSQVDIEVDSKINSYALLVDCDCYSGIVLFNSYLNIKAEELKKHFNRFSSAMAYLLRDKVSVSSYLHQSKVFSISTTAGMDVDEFRFGTQSCYRKVVLSKSQKSVFDFYALEANPFSAVNKINEGYLKLNLSFIKLNTEVKFDVYV